MGSDVEPLVNCRIASAVGVVGGRTQAAGSPSARSSNGTIGGSPRLGHDERRPARDRSTHQPGVGVADALPGLGDELVDRRQAHRQRQHHDGGARQPGGLDGGHELTSGGRQQRDVVARADPAGLQRGGVALGLLVEVAPGDDVLAATHDERDGGGRRGGALEALEE